MQEHSGEIIFATCWIAWTIVFQWTGEPFVVSLAAGFILTLISALPVAFIAALLVRLGSAIGCNRFGRVDPP